MAGEVPKQRYHQIPSNPFSNSQPDCGLNVNIMSFNIRCETKQDGKNHWIFRHALANKILKNYSPDVLGLQGALCS
jgi:mRNA deadenylase 3'-5' endonuclease subunit Ccr4